MFTQQERTVAVVLVLVLLCGSFIQFLTRRSLSFSRALEITESDQVYPKLNVNTASQEELVSLPYIGEYTARRIISYRNRQMVRDLEELKTLKGIKEKNFKVFSRYLTVK